MYTLNTNRGETSTGIHTRTEQSQYFTPYDDLFPILVANNYCSARGRCTEDSLDQLVLLHDEIDVSVSIYHFGKRV